MQHTYIHIILTSEEEEEEEEDQTTAAVRMSSTYVSMYVDHPQGREEAESHMIKFKKESAHLHVCRTPNLPR